MFASELDDKFIPNKQCFHPDSKGCRGKIKKAHSLQRNGVLNLIEESINNNNKVLSLDSYSVDRDGKVADFKLIGKAEASTFFGFCDFHDSYTFSQIENVPFEETDEQLFLHSYRAFAHSYHRKTELLSFHERLLNKYGPNEFTLARIISENRSLKNLDKSKKIIDNILIEKKYQNLDYFLYKKDKLIPVACSSLFAPRCTFNGTVVNTFRANDSVKGLIMVNVFPESSGCTYILLSCLANDTLAQLFITELENLDDILLERAITSILIEYVENTFMSPSIYNNMTAFQQRSLRKQLDLCNPLMYSSRAKDGFFLSNLNFFA